VSQQSRRDLYQAHRLMTQRAALALLRGEPDVPDQPLRRLNVAAISSVLVAVIVAAVFVIWALLTHGGAALQREPGTLVIDKQTGQSYVFCEKNKLCPVVNYASARLALRAAPANLDQQTVSQAALTGIPRGPLIGIPGLPQPLPEPDLLIRQPWSVCERTEATLSGQRTITALAGGIATGGRPIGNNALLVQDLGQDWVVWDGERLAIQPGVLTFVFGAQQVASVPTAWLNSLPEGPAFAAPAIPGLGRAVAGVAGGTAKVGQLYQVNAVAGSPRYYVLLSDDRLARITPVELLLLESQSDVPRPVRLNPSQVLGHLSTATLGPGLPSSVPVVAGTGASAPLCVVYAAPGGVGALTRQVLAGGRMPSGGIATSDPTGVGQVVLPAGRGALVGAAPGTGQSGGAISYFLVADGPAGTGQRYALASGSVAAMLGYKLSQAVLLPAGVIDLIPEGPALSPAAAVRPVPSGGSG
jgi:type VII secretion protein EccB